MESFQINACITYMLILKEPHLWQFKMLQVQLLSCINGLCECYQTIIM